MLDQHDIGLMVAQLYDAKAQFLEAKKRFKDAAETYELGIRRSAQPVAWIRRKCDEFTGNYSF